MKSREVRWQVQKPDQLLHIAEVLQTARIAHTRCDLQLDELRQAEVGNAFEFNSSLGRIGEAHGLGLAVAGVFTGDQELDAYTILGVAEGLAGGER